MPRSRRGIHGYDRPQRDNVSQCLADDKDVGDQMRTAYRSLALLIAVGVVVQAAAIAFGLFGLWGDVDEGNVITDDYDGNGGFAIHSIGALVISLAALLLLLTAFFVKIDGALKWAGLVVGLVVLQWVLAIIAFDVAFLGALHAINAFLIAGAASAAAARAKITTAADETVATAP